jgi:hypothetical protein
VTTYAHSPEPSRAIVAEDARTVDVRAEAEQRTADNRHVRDRVAAGHLPQQMQRLRNEQPADDPTATLPACSQGD